MTNDQKRGSKKEMEYPDAPSGSVMLYNYKEPFMPFQAGHGYEGVLLFDTVTDLVQCHFCGDWFKQLPVHLKREHAMSAAEYKQATGLMKKTALMGESTRSKFIARGLEKRKANLARRVWKGHTKESRAKISATLRDNAREKQNKRGTCPEQLLERIREKYRTLGRQIRADEVRGRDTIIKMYGSWEEACRLAGVPYSNNQHVKQLSHTEDSVVAWILDFTKKNGRMPTTYDARFAGRRTMVTMTTRRLGGWERMCKLAAKNNKQYQELVHGIYTRKQLLTAIGRFKKAEGRLPAQSDCRRGLLPSVHKYVRVFGSWNKALKEYKGVTTKPQCASLDHLPHSCGASHLKMHGVHTCSTLSL